MKISFSTPAKEKLSHFVKAKTRLNFTYVGITETKSAPPKGFDFDHNSILIGRGQADFEAAKAALQNWQQFPKKWTRVYTEKTPPFENQTVAVLFNIFGFWWWNSSRIVYTFSELNRFGYAYGTLPGHVEKGEEVFYIEKNQDDEVFYHIKAFSKPAYWLIWMAYPLARYFQRKFVKESMIQMKNIVTHHE